MMWSVNSSVQLPKAVSCQPYRPIQFRCGSSTGVPQSGFMDVSGEMFCQCGLHAKTKHKKNLGGDDNLYISVYMVTVANPRILITYKNIISLFGYIYFVIYIMGNARFFFFRLAVAFCYIGFSYNAVFSWLTFVSYFVARLRAKCKNFRCNIFHG